jgi:sugar transferase (PEP-CTERM/EpsH1 system associated)
MLSFFLASKPLSFGYFFSRRMKKDIKKALQEGTHDVVYAYCTSTAQYVLDVVGIPKCIDFIDIDSDKWKNFAVKRKFPFSLIYRLEYERLRKAEKKISETFDISITTTEAEQNKLRNIDPSNKERVSVITNGVDFKHFNSLEKEKRTNIIVFTGQMNYFPNIDAVVYFCKEILPLIKAEVPDVMFYIVGRDPALSVKKLTKSAFVTGAVKDIRDYLYEASVYVAPLRISQGVLNKILEAMASGLPVVATNKALQGIKAKPGRDILIGDTPEDFAAEVVSLLKDKEKQQLIARNAKKFVEENHNWEKNLSGLDKLLSPLTS